MGRKKRILIAPLDWGLGHATRCIPIIRSLIEMGYVPVIGASGGPASLLKGEFPELEHIQLKGIPINYPKKTPFPIYFALKSPQLMRAMKREYQATQRIVDKHSIDAIISDNRYGVYSDRVPSAIVTHQLFVKSPLFPASVHRMIERRVRRFDACWVPDFEGEDNLSGSLSHGKSRLTNIQFIGPLSRFSNNGQADEIRREILVILSGPEPQRSSFEKRITEEVLALKRTAIIVRGKPGENRRRKLNDCVEIVDFLGSDALKEMMLSSSLVICRSGYSSIMDLIAVQRKALLVPTKGQSEQEYLATYLKNRGWFYAVEEMQLDLSHDLKQLDQFTPSIMIDNKGNNGVKAAIEKLLAMTY